MIFVRSARSPKHLLVLRAGYFKCLASEVASSNLAVKNTTSRRERCRSSNNQCKHRTSGSIQFYKAIARPASKHQRRSPAHITSYPRRISILRAESCGRRKTRPNRRRATEVIPQSSSATHHLREKHFRLTTFDWKAI